MSEGERENTRGYLERGRQVRGRGTNTFKVEHTVP